MGSRQSEENEALLLQADAALEGQGLQHMSASFQTNVIFALHTVFDFFADTLSPDADQYLTRLVESLPPIKTRVQLLKLIKMGAADCCMFLEIPENRPDPIPSYEDPLFRDLPPTGFLARFLTYARTGRAPVGFYFWAGVSALSVACHKKLFTSKLGYKLWMNQYIILSGARSLGKGQACEPAIALLNLVNTKLEEQLEISTRNAATSEDPDARPDYKLLSKRIEIIPEDSTPEAILKRLRKRQENYFVDQTEGRVNVQTCDGSGLLYLDELATFLGKDKHASSNRGVFLTTMKEKPYYDKDTSGEGEVKINRLAFSLLAGVAEDWFSSTIDRDMLKGGLMDRCTWIHREFDPSRAKASYRSYPRDPLLLDALADWIIENVLCFDWETQIDFTQEALKLLEEHRTKLVEIAAKSVLDFGEDISQYSADRHQGHVAQLACMLALSDRTAGPSLFVPVVVDESHVSLSLRIMEEEFKGMEKVFAKADRDQLDTVAMQMLNYIDEQGGCVKKSALVTKFKNKCRPKDSEGVHRVMKEMQILEKAEYRELLGPKGAPRKMYRTRQHIIDGGCPKCGEL